MKRAAKGLLALIVCSAAFGAAPTRAEEGGSGHYLPGGAASFIDMLPGRNSFGYLNAFTWYAGSASATLPLSGQLVADMKATVYADTSILLWESPWKIGNWEYGAAVAIPYTWVSVEATLQGSKVGLRQEDSSNGFGDIEVIPLMLVWPNGDLKLQGTFGVFMPTGSYDKTRLANVGKNYWTFEPAFALSYLGSKNGREATVFLAFDFNTENTESHYKSGNVFHMDATLAQHLPLFGGVAGLGVNGFYYQQISTDSVTGAVLGEVELADFKARTLGVGPVLSYIAKIGKVDIVAEAKWLPEMSVEKRLKGDIVWVKVAALF